MVIFSGLNTLDSVVQYTIGVLHFPIVDIF